MARESVSGFIRFRVCLLGLAKGMACSPGFARVHSGAHRGCRVNSGSREFSRARVEVSGFIRFRVGSPGRALLSPDSF